MSSLRFRVNNSADFALQCVPEYLLGISLRHDRLRQYIQTSLVSRYHGNVLGIRRLSWLLHNVCSRLKSTKNAQNIKDQDLPLRLYVTIECALHPFYSPLILCYTSRDYSLLENRRNWIQRLLTLSCHLSEMSRGFTTCTSVAGAIMKQFIFTIFFLLILIVMVLNLRTLETDPTVGKRPLPVVESTAANESRENLLSSQPITPLDIPGNYTLAQEHSEPCEYRLGLSYLKEFRHNRAAYCSADSPSQLTCFHAQTDKKDRIDSFCIGQGVKFDPPSKKFQLSCDMVSPRGSETNEASIPLQDFQDYWCNTGPRHVMDVTIDWSPKDMRLPQRSGPETFTILLKREGARNLWHCLLEIMSLSMSVDVLRMSPKNDRDNSPFFTAENAENTQVVVLDDVEDGPYFDLWQLFAKKPIVRVHELPLNAEIGNIIIPLPGGSNPLVGTPTEISSRFIPTVRRRDSNIDQWQGDWEPNSCESSELLRTFSWRVRQFYEITETRDKEHQNKVIVTIIARRGSRKLVGMDERVAVLKDRYTHAKIQVVDLEELSFAAQIQLVHNSDVLAGVHGAGLTHGLWMKSGSTMVEILPEGFNHKGFRNLAGALGHNYFSIHGKKPYEEDKGWQNDDIALEEDRFLKIMDDAIASELNKGRLNFDVI